MKVKGGGGRWTLMAAILVFPAWNQEIDTVILKSGRSQATFLDEIPDSAERSAFEKLSQIREPNQRLSRAEEFMLRYPASWLHSRALEIAAKAAIDLDQFNKALNYGRQSLRIFPENPLLVVPLANVAARVGRNREAARYAGLALEYLDRFAYPPSVPGRELRASALLVAGHVHLTEALDVKGPRKKILLGMAADSFDLSLQSNIADMQAAYLFGIALEALGQSKEALPWLAAAARVPGAIQPRALEELRARHRRLAPAQPFEKFRQSIGAARHRLPIVIARGRNEGAAPLTYAGSESCRTCHSAQFASWKQTGMARMFRPYNEEDVVGNFSGREYRDAGGIPRAKMARKDGRPIFELRSGEAWSRFAVDFLIGSKWQQAYVTRGSDGGLHVLPLQYNFASREWINYWSMVDEPGSERADVSRFHGAGPATNYQRNCAPCHTSQLAAAEMSETGMEHSTYRESGINCEMCHGPSAAHARQYERGGAPLIKPPLVPPVQFGKVGARDYVAVCAQCHMQSALREFGPKGEINYRPAAAFAVRPQSRPYDQFLRKAFYKDGRFRETTFIVESFVRSRCFQEGGAHCGSCHNPHPDDAANNPQSLKVRDRPDERCLQCHGDHREHVERHTRHAASSMASRCEACHMPKIMNALLFKAGSHQIDEVPEAALAARFGAVESPNACLLCHTDKDSKWLEQQLSSWRR